MPARLALAISLHQDNQLCEAESLLEEMLEAGVTASSVVEELASVCDKLGKRAEAALLLDVSAGRRPPGGSSGFYSLLGFD